MEYDFEKDILMTEAMFRQQLKMEQKKGGNLNFIVLAMNFMKQLRKKLLSKNTNKKMLLPCWKIGQEYQVGIKFNA